uniref:Reticulocalbin-3 n=1 Tax=Dendroctonus ponderosae TaxID=77166 RepID=J3JWL0_DENPD|nr:unknown [Dendroctonus ponderosae]
MRVTNIIFNWLTGYVIVLCSMTCWGAVMHKNFHSHDTLNSKSDEGKHATNREEYQAHMNSDEHRTNFDHEAILGSAKISEEFDALPPEQSKERLQALLNVMDTSRDKFIDRSELIQWIVHSFQMLSAEEANEKFDETDENDDKHISWNEYLLESYGSEELSLQSNWADSDENIRIEFEQDQELFRAVDANNDDLLNRQEFSKFTNPEEHQDLSALLLKQILRSKDTDNDDALNFKEFLSEKGSQMSKEALISQKDEFDEYDMNKDGKLTGDEIIYWMFPQNEKIAEEETTHLFAQCDDNHDDLLSFDEILDHHEIFVGSEATNYGEHLHNIHEFTDEL